MADAATFDCFNLNSCVFHYMENIHSIIFAEIQKRALAHERLMFPTLNIEHCYIFKERPRPHFCIIELHIACCHLLLRTLKVLIVYYSCIMCYEPCVMHVHLAIVMLFISPWNLDYYYDNIIYFIMKLCSTTYR